MIEQEFELEWVENRFKDFVASFPVIEDWNLKALVHKVSKSLGQDKRLAGIDFDLESLPRTGTKVLDYEDALRLYKLGELETGDLIDLLVRQIEGVDVRYVWAVSKRTDFDDVAECDPREALWLETSRNFIAAVVRLVLTKAEHEYPGCEQICQRIESVSGMQTLFAILDELGTENLKPSESNDRSLAAATQRFVRKSWPNHDDSFEDFSAEAQTRIAENKLQKSDFIKLAFLAPQWLHHIEHFLEEPLLHEAVCWFAAPVSYTHLTLPTKA